MAPTAREAALADVAATVRVAEGMPAAEATDLLARSAAAYAQRARRRRLGGGGRRAGGGAGGRAGGCRTSPPGPAPAAGRAPASGSIHPQLQTLYLAALALRRSLDDGYLPPSHTLRHLARLTVRDADGGVWLIEPSTGRFLRQEVADPHTFEPAELPDPAVPGLVAPPPRAMR